jgi:hypothetical protein|tara:strand:- start:173 stop:529 length:357 start_codon:yes stop_codon:yes gene_type:complete
MEKEEKQFVAVVLFLVVYLSNYPVGFDLAESEHHALPCYTVKGEVIAKEEINNDYILYVITEIDGEKEGYALYVTEETYKNHDVGETYERITCELAYLNEIKTIIDELLDAGIMEVNE